MIHPIPYYEDNSSFESLDQFKKLQNEMKSINISDNSCLILSDDQGNFAEYGPGAYSYKSIKKSF